MLLPASEAEIDYQIAKQYKHKDYIHIQNSFEVEIYPSCKRAD